MKSTKVLLLLGLISITVPGHPQPKQNKSADEAVATIERFRRAHGRLPNSLSEAGLPDSRNGDIFYCLRTENDFLVSFVARPGVLHSYDSNTKKWADSKGGVCIAPSTRQEHEVMQDLEELEKISSDERAHRIAQLALQIRHLPASSSKVNLAAILANDSTDGEFDRDAAQAATSTLNEALREHPTTGSSELDDDFYRMLAQAVRYEHLKAALSDSRFSAAMARLAADDERRAHMDFTLPDLQGKSWRLRDLDGKVVLVYFWAPWCAPCFKEMQDLEALYEQYAPEGLIVLGLTPDTEDREIQKFVAERRLTYPILLDRQGNVWNSFDVRAFAQLFAYGRDGKLLAQSPDARTYKQLLAILEQAGIR